MKDHYQVLGIGPKATADEIKKSFRKLAHEYHPDKNQGNTFAAARFREIHESYTILNNEARRTLYDHERWLSGRFTKTRPILTPEYLLLEIQKLNTHIATIDVYRMNKQLLHQYLKFILRDENIAVILLKAKEETISGIVDGIMKATSAIPHYFAIDILSRLGTITVNNPYEEDKVNVILKQLTKEKQWEKLYPWIALMITLLLCVAMYFFNKK